MIRRLSVLAGALVAAACSTAGESPTFKFAADRDHVGRIYHYVRSNRDGSAPEHVHVFHKSATQVETYKMVEKCVNAALVTADLDRNIWSAKTLVGGRLGRDATQLPFATLTLNEKARRLDAKVEAGEQPVEESLDLQSLPWFLYDFDFSDLTVNLQHLADYTRDFSLETALIWLDPSSPKFLKRLGRADFAAQGLDEESGAYRFAIGGEAFPDGGAMLLDKKDGHVLSVESAAPNHAEYDDFKLVLVGVDDGGESAWRALLLSHFEGCPEE